MKCGQQLSACKGLKLQERLCADSQIFSNFLPSAEDFDFPAKLKMTCEQFIMSVTNFAIEPILSFITKVSAIKVAVHNRSLVTEGSKALMEQAFPTPDKVAEMVATVNEAKKVQLPGG
jgi:hypothetical protein